MMARRKRGEDNENLDRWLLTYADLITLLLAFFIVMYSMSQVDAKKFGKMSRALSGALKGGSIAIKRGNDIGVTSGKGVMDIGHLMSIGKMIEEDSRKKGDDKPITTEMSERGLVIHIVESALFKQGSAKLEPQAQSVLEIVSQHLKGIDNHVRIEGHTDNVPINTVKYPSNWELSSARATEVVRYFIDNKVVGPNEISALGYGEYRPLKPNNTIENRARNRRVDIVILTMEMTQAEPTSGFYNP
ncbi:MAG TPA: chemotaxis protein MotB [candidate division Zixibacteria bacterium]|nr:chemotaxis protein MotB [candidate division Zixibacteria bacterium]